MLQQKVTQLRGLLSSLDVLYGQVHADDEADLDLFLRTRGFKELKVQV